MLPMVMTAMSRGLAYHEIGSTWILPMPPDKVRSK